MAKKKENPWIPLVQGGKKTGFAKPGFLQEMMSGQSDIRKGASSLGGDIQKGINEIFREHNRLAKHARKKAP
jgi:hypothetical protein